MIDVGDMRELLTLGQRSRKPVYLAQGKACVMVLNCAWFGKQDWWPSIEDQRSGMQTMYDIRSQLDSKNAIDATMPRVWNYPDAFQPGVKVCHYTNARTQPWGAYRHKFGRPAPKDRNAVKLWSQHFDRACEAGLVEDVEGTRALLDA